MRFILAQIFGLIALTLISISYFFQSKRRFLIMQAISDIFYASAFFVISAYVAAWITIVSIFKCIYLYFAEKKDFRYTLHFLTIFILIYVIIAIIFWSSPLDIVPIITASLFTLAFCIKDLQIMRYVLIIPNVMLIVYNILITTYTSALLDLVELTVIVVAIIKYHVKNRHGKEKSEVYDDK